MLSYYDTGFILVFNNENLQNKEAEIKEISKKLDKLRKDIKYEQAVMAHLEYKLSSYSEKLAPLDVSLEQLNDYVERKRVNAVPQNIHILSHDEHVIDFEKKINVMNKKRAPFFKKFTKHKNNLFEHEAVLARKKSKIILLQRKKDNLESHVRHGHFFLNKLRTQPKAAVLDFVTEILVTLTQFENDFYANRSINLRMCAFNLREYCENLQSNTLNQNNIREWQAEYLKLCALIFNNFNRLVEDNLTDSEEEFQDRLFKLCQRSHLNINGDLPDELAFKEQCAQLYITPFQNLETLQVSELNKYEAVVSEFKDQLQAISHPDYYLQDVVSRGKRLLKDIEKNHRHTPATTFDYPFATKVLETATHLLRKPYDDEAYDRAELLASNKMFDKKPQHALWQGLLWGMAGALLISLSVSGLIATFGASAPISAICLKLGSVALVKGVALTAGLAGMGMFGKAVCTVKKSINAP